MKKKKEPKVIIKFDPSPYLEQEFLEFVEEVLSWNKDEKRQEKE